MSGSREFRIDSKIHQLPPIGMRKPGPKPNGERNAAMAALKRKGWTYREIGEEFGISSSAALDGIARHYGRGRRERAREAKLRAAVAQKLRTWCEQCERNVLHAEAIECGSPFCKAKAVAA